MSVEWWLNSVIIVKMNLHRLCCLNHYTAVHKKKNSGAILDQSLKQYFTPSTKYGTTACFCRGRVLWCWMLEPKCGDISIVQHHQKTLSTVWKLNELICGTMPNDEFVFSESQAQISQEHKCTARWMLKTPGRGENAYATSFRAKIKFNSLH